MTTQLGWHFAGDTLRDGRPIPPDGEWLVHNGPIALCESGLRWSRRLIDALEYAPGSTICRVECSAPAREDTDKCVSDRRLILWRVDGDALLRKFARRQALSVAHLWEMPAVVKQYLETGDEALRDAAKGAAEAAAGDAARAAVWAAAWTAAEVMLTELVEAAQSGRTQGDDQ